MSIAIEEALEKAVVAETLPRELRSLGFGILAATFLVGGGAAVTMALRTR